MASITFKGNPVTTVGALPKVGSVAPGFRLTTRSLEDVGLDAWAGKKKVVSINPSLDTGVCQATARAFNEKLAARDDVVGLVVTSDSPFAQKRFCEADGITNVVPLSMMRDRKFADDWGVRMLDGPLAGLTARAVVVLDADDKVLYAQLVPEVVNEPDYDAVLAALG